MKKLIDEQESEWEAKAQQVRNEYWVEWFCILFVLRSVCLVFCCLVLSYCCVRLTCIILCYAVVFGVEWCCVLVLSTMFCCHAALWYCVKLLFCVKGPCPPPPKFKLRSAVPVLCCVVLQSEVVSFCCNAVPCFVVVYCIASCFVMLCCIVSCLCCPVVFCRVVSKDVQLSLTKNSNFLFLGISRLFGNGETFSRGIGSQGNRQRSLNAS